MDKNNKKQEDVSPQDLWKNVCQQLTSKKYETASKIAYNTMFDFSSITQGIKKVKEERIECLKKKMIEEMDSKNEGEKVNTCNASIIIGKTTGKPNDLNPLSVEISREKLRERFFSIETENSLLHIPIFKEIEPNFTSKKKRKVPSFFPKHTFVMFNNPNFYKKFDIDTLFFIFYYFKGMVQQTYAAIRLKNCAWRYHLKYKMWFQRLDEPKLITSEYEKGEFLFFDYETTWNFMKKNDFVFEYFYLEHNDYY